jgi:hypothetical protein
MVFVNKLTALVDLAITLCFKQLLNKFAYFSLTTQNDGVAF